MRLKGKSENLMIHYEILPIGYIGENFYISFGVIDPQGLGARIHQPLQEFDFAPIKTHQPRGDYIHPEEILPGNDNSARLGGRRQGTILFTANRFKAFIAALAPVLFLSVKPCFAASSNLSR